MENLFDLSRAIQDKGYNCSPQPINDWKEWKCLISDRIILDVDLPLLSNPFQKTLKASSEKELFEKLYKLNSRLKDSMHKKKYPHRYYIPNSGKTEISETKSIED